MQSFWELPIIDGPLPWIVWGLAVVLTLALLARRWTPGAGLAAAVAAGAGAVAAIGAFWYAQATDAFGGPLPREVLLWAVLGLAATGLAIAAVFRPGTLHRVLAVALIVAAPLAAGLGINALYGLTPTLGNVFGIVVEKPIAIPTLRPSVTPTATPDAGPAASPTATPTPTPEPPVYASWQAPAGMQPAGRLGTQAIPGATSGFAPRPAGIYLPPAALVDDPPALPLVIFMMGYPGTPEPKWIGGVMDEFAARHDGLAPIVIVPDQIGTGGDPACADSAAFGNARTYVTVDVVDWALANLNISHDPANWVIGGYSNGGGCATVYGALHPERWKHIVSLSGEPYPGSEDPDDVLRTIYGGDTAAFEAAKPVNILAAAPSGTYAGMTAFFSAGAGDPQPHYITDSQMLADAAGRAGMTATQYTIPGATHAVGAVSGGLREVFKSLYPALGLSPDAG